MKISKRTIDVLKNFQQINPSLMFRTGNVLTTMAASKKIVARVHVDESFERDFGVYELSKLLGTLSMMSDPDVETGESSLKITSEGREAEYVYSPEETIVSPPEKQIELPSVDAEFDLPAKTLAEIMKSAGVLGVTHVVVSGDGVVANARAVDAKNPSSHSFRVDLGPCESRFQSIFRIETFKFLPVDYRVEVSAAGIAKFSGDRVQYWTVAEKA